MGYCDRCGFSPRSYVRHTRESSNHNICDDCEIDFATYVQLQGHWRESPNHDYCQYCDEHFNSYTNHRKHNRKDHRDHYCEDCDKVFWRGGAAGLHAHNRQSHADRYCVSCERMFNSENNLRGVCPSSFLSKFSNVMRHDSPRFTFRLLTRTLPFLNSTCEDLPTKNKI